MIKAVLFDFGGVLSTGGQNVKTSLAAMLGISPDEVMLDQLHEDYRRGLISTQEFFEKFGKKHGTHVTHEDFNKSSDIFAKSKPVYELARRLHKRGIRTGILSNIYPITALQLKEQGYYDGFDPLVLSSEEHFAKPDPEFYEVAMAKLGVKPEEVLFIDDQDKCLPPARAMGMKVIKAISAQQIVRDATSLLDSENNKDL